MGGIPVKKREPTPVERRTQVAADIPSRRLYLGTQKKNKIVNPSLGKVEVWCAVHCATRAVHARAGTRTQNPQIATKKFV